VVASLVAEYELWGTRTLVVAACGSVIAVPGLQSTGSVVVVHGLTCSIACRIFLGQSVSCVGRHILYHLAIREDQWLYSFFFFWILPLRIIILRLIHVVPCINSLFLFMTELYSIL